MATTPLVGPVFLGLSPVLETDRIYASGPASIRRLDDGWARRGSAPTSGNLVLSYRGADFGLDLAALLGAQTVRSGVTTAGPCTMTSDCTTFDRPGLTFTCVPPGVCRAPAPLLSACGVGLEPDPLCLDPAPLAGDASCAPVCP